MRFRLSFPMLLMVGCVAAANDVPFMPVTPLPADKATVYIYRPKIDLFWAGYPEIFVNGEKKFRLKNGRYGVVTVPPGEYEIKVEGKRSHWFPPPAIRPVTVEAGHEYYVRVIPVLPPGVKPGAHLLFKNNVSRTQMTLVQKDEALKEITETKLVE